MSWDAPRLSFYARDGRAHLCYLRTLVAGIARESNIRSTSDKTFALDERAVVQSSPAGILRWLIAPLLAFALLQIPARTGEEGGLFAQSIPDMVSKQSAGSAATFRVRSSLVIVPVSITDAKGVSVRDLRVGDFQIEEEGKIETISVFGEPGEASLDLALLFDVSGSVEPRFDFEREAAKSFLWKLLRPRDTLAMFAIGAEPRMIQKRTFDVFNAIKGLDTIQPTKEPTAFFDAVVLAAHELVQNPHPGARRVEIVLSDGQDNQSKINRVDDVIREVQQADCTFYAINPAGRSVQMNEISRNGHEAMELIAQQTGGTAFAADRSEDLAAIFGRIVHELEAQYLLGYYSSDPRVDDSFRRIIVRVPQKPDVRIKARQGYYAAVK